MFLDSLDLLLEIALEAVVLLDAEGCVLLFGKPFADLGGNGTGIGQHFVFVECEEGIETFCVMEAIRRSAKTGDVVKVGPILDEVGLVTG